MKIEIEIANYLPSRAIRLQWEPGFVILSRIRGDSVTISANQAGLISLARHLLTLSQSTVPPGNHLHLDPANSLEEGSYELIIEKIE